MMRCPYRKARIKYTPDENGTEESEETFPECHRDTCPLYDGRRRKCARVQAEINASYVWIKGEKNASTDII